MRHELLHVQEYINTYLGVNIVLVIEVELALECHSDDMKCVKGGNTADGSTGRRWWGEGELWGNSQGCTSRGL